VLSVTGLSGMAKPQEASFDLRRGEILGLAGLVGAGRTELLRSIFALDAVRSGRVRVGAIYPPATPKARIRAGLAFVSEDRKREGLALTRSIADNITYSRLSPYSRAGWLNLNQSCFLGFRRRIAVGRQSTESRFSPRSPSRRRCTSPRRAYSRDRCGYEG
jgi:ABC-type sugar transport system ATPase subunit